MKRNVYLLVAVMFISGRGDGVHGATAAVDFPSLAMTTRRCGRHPSSSSRRIQNEASDDGSTSSSSFHSWWRRSRIFPFNTSWLDEWMNEVTRDIQERSLRFEEYWDDCESASQWVQWLYSVSACYKRLSLSVPSLTREERFILRSWGQCMAPSSSSADGGFHNNKHRSTWTTEDLVAIEQAVETLACSSLLHLSNSSLIGRMRLSLFWSWFRFRNECLLPLVLGKDRFEAAFPQKASSSSPLLSSSSLPRTLATIAVTQYRNTQRACRCLLTWEQILIWLAVTIGGVVALVKEAMKSSRAARLAYSNRNRMALRPNTRDTSNAHGPLRRQVPYAQYHPPMPRRSRRIQRPGPAVSPFSREPDVYDSPALFRVAGSSNRGANSPTTHSNFRPRRLPLVLERSRVIRYDEETECPCCFQEYEISPPEFNDSARLPILSEACTHSYCLDCATRDRDMVMKRQEESLSFSGSAFSSSSFSARTTRTALSYLYGNDNHHGEDDFDQYDDDDDDAYSMMLRHQHRAVRCPFCREPDAFEVDRPILRPDAYAAYRKQMRERQERIKQQRRLGNNNIDDNGDNDKTTDTNKKVNTKIRYYNLD
jgi:hypothetical protein